MCVVYVMTRWELRAFLYLVWFLDCCTVDLECATLLRYMKYLPDCHNTDTVCNL